jgi:hypothetical protein
LSKRTITPAYVIFFILFLPDTWRILMGIALAVLLGPYLIEPEMAASGRAIIFLMLATIGYAVTGMPARWITQTLKKLILGTDRN